MNHPQIAQPTLQTLLESEELKVFTTILYNLQEYSISNKLPDSTQAFLDNDNIKTFLKVMRRTSDPNFISDFSSIIVQTVLGELKVDSKSRKRLNQLVRERFQNVFLANVKRTISRSTNQSFNMSDPNPNNTNNNGNDERGMPQAHSEKREGLNDLRDEMFRNDNGDDNNTPSNTSSNLSNSNDSCSTSQNDLSSTPNTPSDNPTLNNSSSKEFSRTDTLETTSTDQSINQNYSKAVRDNEKCLNTAFENTKQEGLKRKSLNSLLRLREEMSSESTIEKPKSKYNPEKAKAYNLQRKEKIIEELNSEFESNYQQTDRMIPELFKFSDVDYSKFCTTINPKLNLKQKLNQNFTSGPSSSILSSIVDSNSHQPLKNTNDSIITKERVGIAQKNKQTIEYARSLLINILKNTRLKQPSGEISREEFIKMNNHIELLASIRSLSKLNMGLIKAKQIIKSYEGLSKLSWKIDSSISIDEYNGRIMELVVQRLERECPIGGTAFENIEIRCTSVQLFSLSRGVSNDGNDDVWLRILNLLRFYLIEIKNEINFVERVFRVVIWRLVVFDCYVVCEEGG